uniref:Uncharacterized protein n=1 Tax=Oryza sativa subsp. japonica TaxID=39947 RepID=Q5ZAI9_ORYSJ|nr:hypothetical protein [Oryza sativa Japonica Group]
MNEFTRNGTQTMSRKIPLPSQIWKLLLPRKCRNTPTPTPSINHPFLGATTHKQQANMSNSSGEETEEHFYYLTDATGERVSRNFSMLLFVSRMHAQLTLNRYSIS